jgi:hypothetical protein
MILNRLLTAFLFIALPFGAFAQEIGGIGTGGAGGGTVTQGTPASSANAWPTVPTIGGAANAIGNPMFVQLTTGVASLGTVGLNAGSNIVGKFGIDQTTQGVTNAVSIVPLTNAQGGNLTPVFSPALEPSRTLKAGAGNLYSVYATSTASGVAGFLVCVNSTTITAGAITPVDFVAMGAGPTTVGISYSPGPPAAYSTGITCAETVAATPFTYTAPAAVVAYHGLVD